MESAKLRAPRVRERGPGPLGMVGAGQDPSDDGTPRSSRCRRGIYARGLGSFLSSAA